MRQDIGTFPRFRVAMWAFLVALLLAPAIAMRFTDEVDWGAPDFAAAAILLFSLGAAVDFAFRLRRSAARFGVIAAALSAVLIIWADAAVGVF